MREYFSKVEVFIIVNNDMIDVLEYCIMDRLPKVPKIHSGGFIPQFKRDILIGGGRNLIKLKTMTKKRFIKLVMSQGYQRNDALKIHNEYMKKYNSRNKLCLMFFIASYKEPLEIKLMIGGIDVSITDN